MSKLFILAGVLITGQVMVTGQALMARQPNVIIIYADDWGYGDLSLHGHATITTPNLDQLAREGTEFLQFNVCNPVCSASRTALMTGRFPSKYNIHQHFADHDQNMSLNMPDWLDPGTVLLSRLFKEAGYMTAHYGKWHLTNGGVVDPPHPTVYGYDETFVHNGPGPSSGVGIGVETGKNVENSIKFFNKYKDDHPVFINLWIHESHTKIDPPQDAKDAYAHIEEPYRSYYACISYADRELGKLFQYLKQENLDSNTLVIFSSDNGPENPSTDPTALTYYSRGETAGLRGQKRSLHEGGVGVPFFVHWPGKVPAGRINNNTQIAAVDMLPTLCNLTGIDLPDGYIPDGEDVSASFLGDSLMKRSGPLFWEWRGTSWGENWPRLGVRSGDWKLLCNYDGSLKTLYNIQANRKEYFDSAAVYPDLADSLFRVTADWKASLPVNIPIGSVKFRTDKTGKQVLVDFAGTGSTLKEVSDTEFRLYRADNKTRIPISGISHDANMIYLDIDPSVELKIGDELNIAFRSGRVRDELNRELLFFSVEPVYNDMKVGPDLLVLEFIILDAISGSRLANADVVLDSISEQSNQNGQAYFHLEKGGYTYRVSLADYSSAGDTLLLNADSTVNIYLSPTTADVKFRIRSGGSAVYKAEIELDGEKKLSNSIGIALFEDLSVDRLYPFSVGKSGFETVIDSFVHSADTIIEVELTPVSGLNEAKNGGIRVYPNPASGNLYVESGTDLKRIELLGMDGRVLRIMKCNGYSAVLKLNGIEEGLCLVRIYTRQHPPHTIKIEISR